MSQATTPAREHIDDWSLAFVLADALDLVRCDRATVPAATMATVDAALALFCAWCDQRTDDEAGLQ